MIATYPLPAYVQRFFTERLLTQMQASPNTIASYRDTFRLLLKYAAAETNLPPTDLHVAHIDADIVGRFLTFCEDERGNSARSRNTRLAAIRSFFKYVAGSEPVDVVRVARLGSAAYTAANWPARIGTDQLAHRRCRARNRSASQMHGQRQKRTRDPSPCR